MSWLGQLGCSVIVFVIVANLFFIFRECGAQNETSTWGGTWQISPTTARNSWSLLTRIPMTTDKNGDSEEDGRGKNGFKVKKKFRKYLLPLLIAYKLKFFALIPVMIGMLLLLTGATGLAGFFFALFAATMGLSKPH